MIITEQHVLATAIILIVLVVAVVCLVWHVEKLRLRIDRIENDRGLLLAKLHTLTKETLKNRQPEQVRPYRSTVTPEPCGTEDWLDYQ